jgi:hypothetical protein
LKVINNPACLALFAKEAVIFKTLFSGIRFQKEKSMPTVNYKYEKRKKELEKKKKKAEKERQKEIKKNSNKQPETQPPPPATPEQ